MMIQAPGLGLWTPKQRGWTGWFRSALMFDLYKAKIPKLCQMSRKTQHFQIFSGVLTKNCQNMPKLAIFWCQMYSLAMLLRLLMILVPKTPKFRRNHKWLILEHPNYQIFTVLPDLDVEFPKIANLGIFYQFLSKSYLTYLTYLHIFPSALISIWNVFDLQFFFNKI